VLLKSKYLNKISDGDIELPKVINGKTKFQDLEVRYNINKLNTSRGETVLNLIIFTGIAIALKKVYHFQKHIGQSLGPVLSKENSAALRSFS